MANHAATPAASSNPDGNSRLTVAVGAVLFVLFAVEGVTVLSVSQLLTAHIWIGVILLGPIALKTASTTWRMVRYYCGDTAYVRKGPPPMILRLLGPVVVVLSLAVVLTGVGLLVIAPASMHSQLLFLHKATFVLWFGAMAIHILGHLLETARLLPADIAPKTRRLVPGAGLRQLLVIASLVVGVVLAMIIGPHAQGWVTSAH